MRPAVSIVQARSEEADQETQLGDHNQNMLTPLFFPKLHAFPQELRIVDPEIVEIYQFMVKVPTKYWDPSTQQKIHMLTINIYLTYI